MIGSRGDMTRHSSTQAISDSKPHWVSKTSTKKSVNCSKRQLKADTSSAFRQNVCVIDRQHIFRNSPPRPTLLELSKRNLNVVRGRPLLARQELVHEKLFSQELAARLAEARLILLGPDVAKEAVQTRARASRKHSDKQPQPPHRVSFLSVSKRVANIIRFRQAAQSKAPGSLTDKENSSLEAAENLPRTPRFSSYMSAAAQYALMKGYEDIIFEKLSSKYPESTTILKRNKTPHHSVAISDKPSSVAKLINLNSKNWSNLKDGREENCSMNSVRSDENIESIDEVKTASKLETRHSSNMRPVCKGGAQEVPGPASDEKRILENETSQSSILDKSTSSFLPNITKHSQTSFRSTAQNTQYLSTNTRRATLISTEHFPEMSSMTSHESLRRDRRIVLSYRIENAMDILDTIKTKSEQALSPRVKCQKQRHIAPLRDFNRWTDQWATEFNSDAVK